MTMTKAPPLLDDISVPRPGRCHECGRFKFGRTTYCSACLVNTLEFLVEVATLEQPVEAVRARLIEVIPIRLRVMADIRRRR